MMRHTGGTAVAAISTRSRPFVRAMASACGGGMMPSCEPSSSMTRTSRTLMRSLTRVRSSRRGLRSNAITTSPETPSTRRGESGLGLASRRYFRLRLPHEIVDRPRAQVPAAPAPYRSGALRHFPIAGDQHVGDLLQLGFADLISNLLLPGVQLDPQARRGHAVPDRRRNRRVAVGKR